MVTHVSVKVPATSANLGPGFDCLSMALNIWNTVHVEIGSPEFDISGEGSKTLEAGKGNLIYKSFCLPFQESGQNVPEIRMFCENAVPIGKGLGSSTAAIIGGLIAGNEISGRPLSQDAILELSDKMEGHVDNAAAAIWGGCQIVIKENSRFLTSKIQVDEEMSAVLFIPDLNIPTKQSRSLLPTQIGIEDAVYNIGRASLLIKSFATGDFAHMSAATGDKIHQPSRQKIFPAMQAIFKAAMHADALGVFLSGAGSSVLALAKGKEISIGYEMAEAASKSGVEGMVKITRPTNLGAQVLGPE